MVLNPFSIEFAAFATKPQTPAVAAYVLGHKVNKDARAWMQGLTPQWVPHVPIDVLSAEFAITKTERTKFALRVLADCEARFGRAALGPAFFHSPAVQPNYSFTWPENPQIWRLAPQETTLAHVAWAFEELGDHANLDMLALPFCSYLLHGWWNPAKPLDPTDWFKPEFEANPSQWSDFRNFGNPKKNYGTAGRHRLVRGCIDYCYHTIKVLKKLISEGPQIEYVQDLLDKHVENLYSQFPLVDDPRGDHFGYDTPFVSVYQTSALLRILRAARSVARPYTVTRIEDLIARIEELVIEYGPCVSSDASLPACDWWYDIPFGPTGPRHVRVGELGAQINKGMSGVAAYHVPLLRESMHPSAPMLYLALRDDAVARQFPAKYPAETAWAFGTTNIKAA